MMDYQQLRSHSNQTTPLRRRMDATGTMARPSAYILIMDLCGVKPLPESSSAHRCYCACAGRPPLPIGVAEARDVVTRS